MNGSFPILALEIDRFSKTLNCLISVNGNEQLRLFIVVLMDLK